MSRQALQVQTPLIKRPLDEIIRVAYTAGKTAATNVELVQSASLDMRFQWIGQAFPEGFGVSDEQFDAIVTQACDSFDRGIDEYCKSLVAIRESVKTCASADDFSQAYRDGVALALERLSEWQGSDQVPSEIGETLLLAMNDHDAERRAGFAETIAAYLMNTMDFGPPIIARWPAFEDLTMKSGARHE